MELNAQIGIVSVFGRGHYLAAKLVQAKVPVTLLDVTDQMGTWAAEDVEGPFGYFDLEGVAKTRLSIDEKNLELEDGFVVWLSDGPVELRGPTSDHRLAQLQIPGTSLEYLKKNPALSATDQAEFRKLSFERNWLSMLSHHLTSSVDTLSSESLKEGLKRNIFEKFQIRHVTAAGHARSLKWCEELGVKVLRHVELKDLVFEERRKVASLEVRVEHPGLFKAEQLVMCLTSEESAMISQKVQQALYGVGPAIEPQWAWMRYRVKFQGLGPMSPLIRDQIPQHCLVIDDLMLPWSHENFVVLQKVPASAELFDVWMKIPNNQRFNSQYLVGRGVKMQDMLEKRLPDNQVLIVDLPAEAKATFQQVGPARHPVYSRAVRGIRVKRSVGNIHFDSPEFWRALSWEGQFEHQEKIYQDLKAWWDHKEEVRIKRELKEAKAKSRGADL
jgi:hypothetical protein